MTSSSTDNNASKEESSAYSDFSIDHILNRAGRSRNDEGGFPEVVIGQFPWLQCTRYCPPRIPRIHKKEGPQKRQLGRHPRIPFTSHQLSILEGKYQQTPYLNGEEVVELSQKLNLAEIRVKIWFQNRRARDRKEKLLPLNESAKKQNIQESSASNADESSKMPSETCQYFLSGPYVTYSIAND